MASRTPPRFVPTLTEVVPQPAAQPPAAAAPPAAAPATAAHAPGQEQLAQRVLQRVDLVLERRLREALGALILEQTEALAPVLRARLEGVVRQVVAEALADEVQARQRPSR